MTTRVLFTALLSLVLLCLTPLIGPPLDGDQAEFIFWQLRVPRAVMGALVGSTLGLVGAVYQTIFVNPLATPSTVGTTAGAALGALAAVVLLDQSRWGGMPAIAMAAFLGALLVTLLVAAIASSGRARMNDVLLAGIALSLAASALTTGLQFQADMSTTFQAVRWSLGNLAQIGYGGVLVLLPFVVVTTVFLLTQTKALEAMVGGEDRAHSQGVDIVRVRAMTLGVGALGVGACVAWCGPIAFVGLIVPHIVRLSLSASRRILLPMSALFGAAFLSLCDAIARVILPGRDLPVGVVTAALGAPLIVWLVTRGRGAR
jgi:ABC-type Fe3+-siderophore transport system permease subunit